VGSPGHVRLLRDRRGANLAEYLILVGLVALLALGGYRAFGSSVSDKAEAQAACVADFGGCAGAQGERLLPTRSEIVDQAADAASSEDAFADAPITHESDGAGDEGEQDSGHPGVVEALVAGAVGGDFAGDQGWSGLAGQTVVGFIPVVGQIADVRDTVAAIRDIREGKDGSWVNGVAVGVAWFPGFGDALKALFRGARRVEAARPGVAAAVSSVAPAVRAASHSDAVKLIDESQGKVFGGGTGHARSHVPRPGEDPVKLARARPETAVNTVFRSGRQGELALRDILQQRASDLDNLKVGDEPVVGTHHFRETREGLTSLAGEPPERVQIREVRYKIVRHPDGSLHIIHFAPVHPKP
jgi:Flp pilus assembly pilin Flp